MRRVPCSGSVVATTKDPSLTGVRLVALEPLDEDANVSGDPFVAIDVVQAGHGQTVFWVSSREAADALEPPFGPVDAAVVGIVDRVNL
ncbi:MAG: EutN/CcmL family microcompartment protein [Candidatus Latescibacteria bacterium]|nr:EutN/CcmL family microcompartment protein [Candidatus Latescibacterota bacterium]